MTRRFHPETLSPAPPRNWRSIAAILRRKGRINLEVRIFLA